MVIFSYFHREVSRLLFGMGDPSERPGFDMTVRWDFLPEVIEVATRRLPALADAEVSHAWAGLYEMTPDGMPIIGPVERLPGCYVIAGFSGHGFQHSPAAGRVLADVITGHDPGLDLSPFRLERFEVGQGAPERNVVRSGAVPVDPLLDVRRRVLTQAAQQACGVVLHHEASPDVQV